MPALGMAQETGKLVRWLKREGEQVAKGEPLMEVETDKAAVEVEAPASGTVAMVTAAEGDEVAVGRQIALILGPGESPPTPEPNRVHRLEATPSTSSEQASEARRNPTRVGVRPGASPKARRLAAERGVDLGRVAGSGPGGAVLEDDVLQAPGAVAAESAAWRAMADNVSRSWREAPHFFVIREVDATAIVRARGRQPDTVTYTDLLIHAVAAALVKHRRVNSSSDEVNIGLAVALPDALIVPVMHAADRLSIAEIAGRRRELLERTRAGRLRAGDLVGGTFAVSNLGMYGVDLFTAILTEGQAGILAVGRIADRVVAREGEPVVRPSMLMSLSCDHRRVDGARAAEFMETLVALMETDWPSA